MASSSSPTFAGQPQTPAEIADHHAAMKAALRYYYLAAQAERPKELEGRSPDNRTQEVGMRLRELDHVMSLALLAAVEAAIRQAASLPPRPTSRSRRRTQMWLHQVTGGRRAIDTPSLLCLLGDNNNRDRLDDILDRCYRLGDQDCKSAISAFKGALKYRHWLAHGRYWPAKLARPYTFAHIYDIAVGVFVDVLALTP